MDAATSIARERDDADQVLPARVAVGFRAAIAEAVGFVGATAPNPPVGCAILDADGRLLTVAAHQRAGTAHAEPRALSQLRDGGQLGRAATLLVTLEPCNHHGRTGPCTEAILASPVREVWIGSADPNPRVAGHGAERLRAAGLRVRALDRLPDPAAATLALDCAALITPFRRWVETGRPWITVKQALDAAGGMIPPAGATTFTQASSLLLAHRLRRATDAIVTGTGTVLADRPALTVRHLPDHAGRAPRLLAIVGRPERVPADYLVAAAARGLDVRLLAELDRLPALLGEAGVLWAMVEAGPGLLRAIREGGLWDDWLTIARAGPDDDPAPDRIGLELAAAAGLPSPTSLLGPFPGQLNSIPTPRT